MLFELQRLADWCRRSSSSSRNLYSHVTLTLLTALVLWGTKVLFGSTSAGGHWVLSVFVAVVLGSMRRHGTGSSGTPPMHGGKERQKQKHRPERLVLGRGSSSSSSSVSASTPRAKIILQSTPTPSVCLGTPQEASTFYSDSFITTHVLVPNTPKTANLQHLSLQLESELGPLPSTGWEIRLSSDLRIYFVDRESGVSTWRDPRLPLLTPIAPQRQGLPVSPGPTMMTPIEFTSQDRDRVRQWVSQRRKFETLRRRVRMSKVERRIGGRGICELLQ